MLEQIEKWARFVLANLLWSILALPVVTLPIATVGLFSVMSKQVQGKQPELFQEFFGAIRRLWLKSAVIFLLDVLVGGLLAVNLTIFGWMHSLDVLALLSRSITLFVMLMLLLTNLYIWSLLVVCDMPVKQLVETSGKLVFAHPLWSCGVLIAATTPIIVSLLLPRGVFFLLTASCCVIIITAGTWPIIQRHQLVSKLSGI